MKERSETRVDSSHVCKLVLIAASEKAFESAFSNRPLGFKRVSVGKIADFSFPGVFRPLFGELTETVKRKSAARGLAAIAPEGRRLFLDQSVENNLILGALHLRRDRRRVQDLLASVYNLFPVLLEYRRRRSSFLSGGEQQMVAIGGILMSDPKILLLDRSLPSRSRLSSRRFWNYGIEERRCCSSNSASTPRFGSASACTS
jgi:energy-coupling factor transporter ATP-binding protein EcfA2